MNTVLTRLLLLAAFALAAACNSEAPAEASADNEELTACQDPRPEACTFEYNPVCGRRDTGIRCVTPPCPSAEWKTYGNACSACGDETVSGYKPGECPGDA